MKRFNSIVFFLAVTHPAIFCQTDSISIIQCIKAARENATLKPQLAIYSDISDLKVKNASSSNLPSLSAYGKATYQSEAVSIPGPTGIEIDLFQYNLGLEANQKLFDGGLARKTKIVETASSESDRNRVETDLYQLNDRVVGYFFASLFYENSGKALELKQSILQKRLAELESGVKNGIIKVSEYDKIHAEFLLTQQQLLELQINKMKTFDALQILTELKISDSTKFFVPDSLSIIITSIRPEYRFFESEIFRMEKTIKLKSAQKLPKLYAFGQLGYSYPGLNFFNNNPDYYYIVGAKLSWPIFDWNQVRRETQVLQKQVDFINTRRDEFDRNLQISIRNEQMEQEKLVQTIALDNEIIEKRTAISASSASSFANGVITSSMYLEDLNAEIKARIDLATHKIHYQNSIVKSYLLRGIDINNL